MIRAALICLVLCGMSLCVHAQSVLPITLTAEEYQQMLNALAARDPVMALLIKKQDEARAAQAQKPSAPAQIPEQKSP